LTRLEEFLDHQQRSKHMKEWRRLFDGFGQMGVENIGKIIEHPQTIRGASNDSS